MLKKEGGGTHSVETLRDFPLSPSTARPSSVISRYPCVDGIFTSSYDVMVKWDLAVWLNKVNC